MKVSRRSTTPITLWLARLACVLATLAIPGWLLAEKSAREAQYKAVTDSAALREHAFHPSEGGERARKNIRASVLAEKPPSAEEMKRAVEETRSPLATSPLKEHPSSSFEAAAAAIAIAEPATAGAMKVVASSQPSSILHLSRTENRLDEFIRKPIDALTLREALRHADDTIGSLTEEAKLRVSFDLLGDLAQRWHKTEPEPATKLAQALESARQNPYRLLTQQELAGLSLRAQHAVHRLEMRQVQYPELYPKLQKERANRDLLAHARSLPQIPLASLLPARLIGSGNSLAKWVSAQESTRAAQNATEERRLLQLEQIRDSDPRIESRILELSAQSINRKRSAPALGLYEQAEALAEGQFRGFYPNQKIHQLAEDLLSHSASWEHRVRCEAVFSMLHKEWRLHDPQGTPADLEDSALALLSAQRLRDLRQVNTAVIDRLQRIEVDALPEDKLRVTQEIEQIRRLQTKIARSLDAAGRQPLQSPLAREDGSPAWWQGAASLFDQPLNAVLETSRGKQAHWERLEVRKASGRLPPAATELLWRLTLDGFDEQVATLESAAYNLKKGSSRPFAYRFLDGNLGTVEPAHLAPIIPSGVGSAPPAPALKPNAEKEQLWTDLRDCKAGLEQSLADYAKFEPQRVADLLQRVRDAVPDPRGPPAPRESLRKRANSPWFNPGLDVAMQKIKQVEADRLMMSLVQDERDEQLKAEQLSLQTYRDFEKLEKAPKGLSAVDSRHSREQGQPDHESLLNRKRRPYIENIRNSIGQNKAGNEAMERDNQEVAKRTAIEANSRTQGKYEHREHSRERR